MYNLINSFNPLTSFAREWEVKNAERLRARFADPSQAHYDPADDSLRWNSNNAPIPMSIFAEAAVTPPAGQAEAERIHTTAAINAYIEGRKNMSAEARAEERFEMRAAFGEGEKVVNVFTGEEFYT